ncbi:MAG TPA: hypothetical protein VM941_12190 [Pyrinomonadaceae bacterium]|jgi:hypothetical protein|nr:hypothetical protein [Pyrinomonadaceae bacterium]
MKQGLPAALIVLSAAISIYGQDSSTKHNQRPNQASTSATPGINASTDPVKYTYEFSQPRFTVKHIVVEHDANGRGTVTFERLNEDTSVTEPLQLSPAALARINASWQALQFLDSTSDYQADKQFPHLGTMRIGMQRGEKKRVAEFNWTNNTDAETLVNEYRKAADQAILIFDISVARQNQPLNAPKLMEGMESLLKRNGLSDPQQLLPLLKELSTDERVPLIARNHALRLIKKIQK